MSHEYRLGQIVRFRETSLVRDNGVYEVVRLLPSAEDQTPQYRVKSLAGQERAAREHELTLGESGAPAGPAATVSAVLG